MSQRTKLLARISSLLDSNTLKTLADVLVQCHFDYACTSLYTGTTEGLKDKLQICQNILMVLNSIQEHIFFLTTSPVLGGRVEERVIIIIIFPKLVTQTITLPGEVSLISVSTDLRAVWEGTLSYTRQLSCGMAYL